MLAQASAVTAARSNSTPPTVSVRSASATKVRSGSESRPRTLRAVGVRGAATGGDLRSVGRTERLPTRLPGTPEGEALLSLPKSAAEGNPAIPTLGMKRAPGALGAGCPLLVVLSPRWVPRGAWPG